MALHDVENPIFKSECPLESFTQSSKLDTGSNDRTARGQLFSLPQYISLHQIINN